MDLALIIIAFILILVGFAGSILPALPGPPLAFVGLVLTYFTSYQPIGGYWLIAYAVMVAIIAMGDFWIPSVASKITNGSSNGIRGANIGMVLCLFLPIPFSVFVGALLGSIVGELISGKTFPQAIIAAFGVFLGLIGSILMQCLLCIMMLFHLILALIF